MSRTSERRCAFAPCKQRRRLHGRGVSRFGPQTVRITRGLERWRKRQPGKATGDLRNCAAEANGEESTKKATRMGRLQRAASKSGGVDEPPASGLPERQVGE